METSKTGAIICRNPDRENGMIYEALFFIKNIPHDITDNDLKEKINLDSLRIDSSGCSEILFRADIHSTSNEVQEQFEHLHKKDMPVPEINFDRISLFS